METFILSPPKTKMKGKNCANDSPNALENSIVLWRSEINAELCEYEILTLQEWHKLKITTNNSGNNNFPKIQFKQHDLLNNACSNETHVLSGAYRYAMWCTRAGQNRWAPARWKEMLTVLIYVTHTPKIRFSKCEPIFRFENNSVWITLISWKYTGAA